MATKRTSRTSPAKKEYTVLADTTLLVTQTVWATSPREAYEIASENDDDWENDRGGEDGDYYVCPRVYDVAAEDFVPVPGVTVTQCVLCGSEIDESHRHEASPKKKR
jgi:hypothetical protein